MSYQQDIVEATFMMHPVELRIASTSITESAQ